MTTDPPNLSPALAWSRGHLQSNLTAAIFGGAVLCALLRINHQSHPVRVTAAGPLTALGAEPPTLWFSGALMLLWVIISARVCLSSAGLFVVWSHARWATREQAAKQAAEQAARQHERLPQRPSRRAWFCAVAGLAFGALAAMQVVWGETAMASHDPTQLPTHTVWALTTLTVAALACGVTALACCRDSGEKTQPPNPPEEEQAEVAVVCSGGGIRSASFCLGALQAMATKEVYRKVDLVVGVSGGGYAAAAFSAIHENFRLAPFAGGSRELQQLRRRTRYLASSPGTMAAGFAVLLWGIVVNATVSAALLTVLGWMVGWEYLVAGTVRSADGRLIHVDVPWGISVLAVVPLVVGLLGYVGPIVAAKVRALLSSGDKFRGRQRPRVPRVHRLRGPLGDPLVWLACGAALTSTLVLLPKSVVFLDQAAAGHVISFWSVIARLLRFYGPAVTGPDWSETINALTAGFGTLAALTGLLGSSQKGRRNRAVGNSSTTTAVVGLFRRAVAPFLANVLAIAVVYSFLANTVRATMMGGHLAGPPWGFVVLVAAAVLLWAVSEANLSSLLPFYRERLGSGWLPDHETGTHPAEATDGAWVKLSKLDERRPRFTVYRTSPPRLVLLATANVSDLEAVPAGRGGTPYVLGEVACGFTDTFLPWGAVRQTTAGFEDSCGIKLDLATAMAISGSAVSPLSGRGDNIVRPFRILMTILNLRTGAWVVNPHWADLKPEDLLGRWTRRWLVSGVASPWYAVNEALGRASLTAPRIFLTDGGHFDNLGLTEALRRGASTVIVLDGTQEPSDTFLGLGQSLATARMDQNCAADNDLGLELMTSTKDGEVARAWTTFRIRRPGGGKPCTVVYLKALLTTDAPLELTAYQAEHREFPVTPTIKQLYDEFDFEAYRLLGETIATSALNDAAVARLFAAEQEDVAARVGPAAP